MNRPFSIRLMLALALFTGFATSCTNDDPVHPETCPPGSGYHMAGIFAQIPAPFADKITYDLAVHQYRFRTDVNGTICNIGYQNRVPSAVYTISIRRLSDGSVLYEDVLQFSATTTEYIGIPPVSIKAGEDYLISRSENGYGTQDKSGVGRVKITIAQTLATLSLPITSGHITILNTYSDFNKGDGSSGAMPFIDFGFSPE